MSAQISMFEESDKCFIDTCNTCENRQRWRCGGRIIQYCGVRKSNRTANGLLKIKCKTKACIQYKNYDTIKEKH